jgi:tetratricopeptide (TPR) repeat protein
LKANFNYFKRCLQVGVFDKSQAIQKFTEAVAMKPSFSITHILWAQLLLEQSQIQKQLGERKLLLEAKQKCQEALALQSNSQRAGFTMADICWYLGEFEEARYWIECCQDWSGFTTFPPYRYSKCLHIRSSFSKVATMTSMHDLPTNRLLG